MNNTKINKIFNFSVTLYQLNLNKSWFSYCDFGNCFNMVVFSTSISYCKEHGG